MQLGVAFGLPPSSVLGLNGYGNRIAFNAPTLIWDGNTNDRSPGFTAVYDNRGLTAPSNWIRLEIAEAGSNFLTSLAAYDHQLTNAELVAGSVNITLTDLADGAWDARLRHTVVQNPLPGTYLWSLTAGVTVAVGVAVNYLLRKDGVSRYLRKDGTSFLLRN